MPTETAYPTPTLSTKKRKRMDQTSGHPLPTNHELSVDSLNLASKAGQEGWTYHLEILQEPLRARACGFGNKTSYASSYHTTVDSGCVRKSGGSQHSGFQYPSPSDRPMFG
ncbi:hypothetical protein I308_101150 [Cryptococcus tetragattii IND107]|uniref:Uncharacterized protein n=1 Tax=Cryptococcus tetragattii IND107 TaxID=1296105 RepID=A0ABR3C035_9TREE